MVDLGSDGKPAGATLVGDVQVGANYLCNQELYVTDSTGVTWHKFATPAQGSGWSDWASMGGPGVGAHGSVSAGENPQNNQELFIVGNDNSVYHDYATPGLGSGWSEWSSLEAPPGTITSTSVQVDTYPVEKLTVTSSAGVYVDTATPGVGSGWSGWTAVWSIG